MLGVVAALIPVFTLIVAGAVMRRLGFPGDTFWPMLERLTYFVLFPGLLFHAVASADFAGAPIGRLGLALAVMMTVMAAALLAVQWLIPIDGPAFTSVFQGAVRWNSFVALAAISALYGKPGLTLAAVAIAIMVPAANVYSVLALSRYGGTGQESLRMMLEQIARNPLIQACAAGVAVHLAGLSLPSPILSVADMLGKSSLTLGLFAVGASLTLNFGRSEIVQISVATILKLIVTPTLAAVLCAILGVDGMARGCALICAAVPGASAAYILAKQLGGDAPLMSGITTAQTLAAMLTMPIMLWLLN